ncbi:MAG: monothiol glutaredoxin, Grx4 family, partial [Deltaproteobacteria bacterium]|nr:monothiol glutaredoxin, Grx4 family [Deltaproteobacteria bacterium]
ADDGDVVHLSIDAKFRADLHVAPRGASDIEAKGAGVALVVDLASAKRASGVTIDFVEENGRAGFKIDNPNSPADVVQIGAEQLKAKLDAGEVKELLDVRTPQEIATAVIKGSRHLDDAAMSQLESLPKDTPLVFYCHTGRRSQTAAEHFIGKGFSEVYNLAGGIDAWSQLVDPSVPRY